MPDAAFAAGIDPILPSMVPPMVPAALGAGVSRADDASVSSAPTLAPPQKISTRKAPRFSCPWYPKPLSMPSAQLSATKTTKESATPGLRGGRGKAPRRAMRAPFGHFCFQVSHISIDSSDTTAVLWYTKSTYRI